MSWADISLLIESTKATIAVSDDALFSQFIGQRGGAAIEMRAQTSGECALDVLIAVVDEQRFVRRRAQSREAAEIGLRGRLPGAKFRRHVDMLAEDRLKLR